MGNKLVVTLLAYLAFGGLLYLILFYRPGQVETEAGQPPAPVATGAQQPRRVVPITPKPQSSPGKVVGSGRVTIQLTHGVDLETGRIAEGAGPRDIWWQAMTSSKRRLSPYPGENALFARLPDDGYDSFDVADAAGLEFSATGFRHGDDGDEVTPGLAFAVRTAEGHLARVRVIGVHPVDRSLTLEWEFMTADSATSGLANAVHRNPSLESRRLLGEARMALRARNPTGAMAALDTASALVESFRPDSEERIRLLFDLGSLYWSARNLDAAFQWTTRATAEIARLPAGAAALPWALVADTYRWMGVLHRNRGEPAASIPWHERALKVSRDAKVRDHNEADRRRMSITSNLRELKDAECGSGNRDKGQEWLQQLQEACKDARSIGVCQPEFWTC